MNALTAFAHTEDDTEHHAAGVYGALEWLVIAIGQRDGRAGACRTPLLTALGRLFAWQPLNQLADPRLEQLRCMAALAGERGWQVPPSEIAAFLRAGWSEDQLGVLIDTVAPPATRLDRRPGAPLPA